MKKYFTLLAFILLISAQIVHAQSVSISITAPQQAINGLIPGAIPVWATGQPQTFTWTTDNVPAVNKVFIELRSSNARYRIAENIPNSGSYVWQNAGLYNGQMLASGVYSVVMCALIPGGTTTCAAEAVNLASSKTQSNSQSTTPITQSSQSPQITFIYPSERVATVALDQMLNIQWSSSGFPDSSLVTLKVKDNSGAYVVKDNLLLNGIYQWTVGSIQNGQRITAGSYMLYLCLANTCYAETSLLIISNTGGLSESVGNDVYVLHDDGNLIKPDNTINNNGVAAKFYSLNPDKTYYDFLTINTTFSAPTIAHHDTVQSNTVGNGQSVIGSSIFGPSNKLLGINYLGENLFRIEDTQEAFLNLWLIAHETGHQWLTFADPVAYGPHYSKWVDTGFTRDSIQWNDTMGGWPWKNNGNGTVSINQQSRTGFSKLSLYLMGLIPSSEVPDTKMVVPQNPDDQNFSNVLGQIKNVSVGEIIAKNGVRVPDYLGSQKDFRMAYILLTKKDEKIAQYQKQLDILKYTAIHFPEEWNYLTYGKSRINGITSNVDPMNKTVIVNFASSPASGVAPLSVNFTGSVRNLPSCTSSGWTFGGNELSESATPSCPASQISISATGEIATSGGTTYNPLMQIDKKHTFNTPGIYQVSYSVGGANAKTTVTVTDPQVNAPPKLPQPVLSPISVKLSSCITPWKGLHGTFLRGNDARIICNNGKWITTYSLTAQNIRSWGGSPVLVAPCTQQGSFYSLANNTQFIRGSVPKNCGVKTRSRSSASGQQASVSTSFVSSFLRFFQGK